MQNINTKYKINFNILTLNVRGMVNDNKRRKVLLWCENQGSDIVFLQETHGTKNRLNQFKDSWKGMSFYSLTDSPFSKGVGIFLDENLPIRITNCKEYMKGRTLLLDLEIYDHLLFMHQMKKKQGAYFLVS